MAILHIRGRYHDRWVFRDNGVRTDLLRVLVDKTEKCSKSKAAKKSGRGIKEPYASRALMFTQGTIYVRIGKHRKRRKQIALIAWKELGQRPPITNAQT